jgi:hypothetical protein
MFEAFKVWLIRKMVKRRLGRAIAPVETMSAHPGVLIPYTRYSQALQKTSAVDAQLKMLAVVRTAHLVACPF